MSSKPELPVTLADIEQAAKVLQPVIARTPIEHSRVLSLHAGAKYS